MSIFIDVNILMYAAGAPHPHKEPCLALLDQMTNGHIDAATDTEALQELLHRYWHLGVPARGMELMKQTINIIRTILPVETPDMMVAGTLLMQHRRLEPRDAVHAAVMLNHGMTHLYSYDQAFDGVAGLIRLEPSLQA